MSLPLPVLNALLGTEALGVAIVALAGKGRGVVATRAHDAGARFAGGEPLAHSAFSPYAYPPAAAPAAPGASARERYAAADRRAAALLDADAVVAGRRRPRLVAQLACRVAREPDDGAFRVVLAALCAARADGPLPAALAADAAAVREALAGGDVDYAFLTDAWFYGVLSRLHLNGIAAGDGATALLGLPSLFNHDRDPSALVDYTGADGDIVFELARPLAAGDEITIDYHYDPGADPAERAAFLLENYGFEE